MSREYTRAHSIFGFLPFTGAVIVSDDFEGRLKYNKVDGAGDSVFEIDPSDSLSGDNSLLLKTRTTAAAEDDEISASRFVHLLPDKIVAFETVFTYPVVASLKSIGFRLFFYDGTIQHTALIQYLPNTPIWQYYNSSGSYSNITNSGLTLNVDTWHRVLLKVNFATDKFLSLHVDHLSFDLSAFALRTAGSAWNLALDHLVTICTSGAAPTQASIDRSIIYEP